MFLWALTSKLIYYPTFILCQSVALENILYFSIYDYITAIR